MTQRRFIRRGVSKIKFHPGVADIHDVTRAEIDAAFDLSDFLREVSGWGLENNSAATPDLGSSFESSIPGTDSASDSSLGFYEDLDTSEIEELLPKDTEGTILILRKGDKPGSPSMDVFPIRVATKTNDISMGNDAAGFGVKANISSEPALDQVIPAIAAAAPVLTSVVPNNNIPAAGGELLILTGVGFSAVTSIQVAGGANPVASQWEVLSDTKIALIAPARAAAVRAVTVTDADGVSNAVNVTYV